VTLAASEPHSAAGNIRQQVIARFISLARLERQSLDRAQQIAARSGDELDVVLNKLGLVSDDHFVETWSEVTDLPVHAAASFSGVPDSGLSLGFIERSGVIPLAIDADSILLGVIDPLDEFVSRAVAAKLERQVNRCLISPTALGRALRELRGAVNGDVAPSSGAEAIDQDVERLSDLSSDAPIISLTNQIIEAGLELRASDIHLSATRHGARLRYRVDGYLRDYAAPPAASVPLIISRLKVMAGLDIAERRLPQDGRIRLTWRGREIDMRVATMPHIDVEGAVLRILDRSAALLDIDALQLSQNVEKGLKDFLARPQGLLLVTGPTGSGKTTTLYAALKHLSGPGRNIISIEDPVEVFLSGVNQVQVNRSIDLDFARALRAALRQDPDVVMIGEIRDRETAEIALQAALTGHLVLATLHTNSAVASVTRLLDMGLEPFMIAATVQTIMAQRLVRTVCPSCRGSTATPELTAERPRCTTCDGTGFSGRAMVAECLTVDSQIRRLIGESASEAAILEVASQSGFVSLLDDGLDKARQGVTTRGEILRVVGSAAP
jgi:general secretion pathway protein E